MGVTNINCSIYKVDIYNPKPTIEYPKGWYSYVGMTTRDDWHDRIEEHKTESKENNLKFYTIRERSNKPWKTELIKQWQKPFNKPNEGLAFMAEYEQYYIKEYQTYNTTYGLNNSPGGDYSLTWPTTNTSGILGVSFCNTKNHWVYVDPYDPKRISVCRNQHLPLLLYQMRDQFGIEPIILDEVKYKESLQKSNNHRHLIKHHHYYTGSPNITIRTTPKGYKKKYAWTFSLTMDDGTRKQSTRTKTLKLIDNYGYLIYTKPLFAYMAIGLENEWLLNNYTVDQSKFMPFREFEKKYTIKDNDQLKKVILDNIIE